MASKNIIQVPLAGVFHFEKTSTNKKQKFTEYEKWFKCKGQKQCDLFNLFLIYGFFPLLFCSLSLLIVFSDSKTYLKKKQQKNVSETGKTHVCVWFLLNWMRNVYAPFLQTMQTRGACKTIKHLINCTQGRVSMSRVTQCVSDIDFPVSFSIYTQIDTFKSMCWKTCEFPNCIRCNYHNIVKLIEYQIGDWTWISILVRTKGGYATSSATILENYICENV